MKVPKARKLPSGTWFIQLRLGGESIPVTAATEKECTRRAALVKAEYAAGKRAQAAAGEEMTLREAIQRHILRKEAAKLSPSTIRGYDTIARTAFPQYMDKRPKQIKNWQAVYDAEAARVSPKTAANAWSLLRSALKKECSLTLPEVDPVSRPRREHAFLEPDQIRPFVSAAVGNKYEIPMLLALSSCRASEILGLDWSDVDLKHKRVYIHNTMVRDKTGAYTKKTETKTEGSTRYVPIFIPELLTALENAPEKHGPVCPVRTNTLFRQINALCQSQNLPPVGVHGLRHPYVKHTTKKYYLQKQKSQATISDNLRFLFFSIQRGPAPCTRSRFCFQGTPAPCRSADQSMRRSGRWRRSAPL